MQPLCQPRAYSKAKQQRVFRQWYPQFLFPPCASTDLNLLSISLAPKTYPLDHRIFCAKKQEEREPSVHKYTRQKGGSCSSRFTLETELKPVDIHTRPPGPKPQTSATPVPRPAAQML
ncbi:hypothetical protein AALO_G00245350 [Alosa alosa]|uniref:Uncharacterized protein n=1 Tax=Alosa alosa TaxID=278164 RepID=A0AAV6FS65_9TELE|nr:hypothetical protein AALO_G00245350 [Alosa alosa]